MKKKVFKKTVLNTLKFKFKRAALSLFKKKPMSKNETSRVIKSPTKIVKPCYWKSFNLLCNFIQITNFFVFEETKPRRLIDFFSRGIAEVTDFFFEPKTIAGYVDLYCILCRNSLRYSRLWPYRWPTWWSRNSCWWQSMVNLVKG